LTYTQKHPKSVNRLVLINAADGLPWWIAFIPQPTLLRWFENHLVSVIPDIGVTSYRDFRKFAHSSDFNLTRIAGDMMHTHLHAYVSILRNTLEFDFRLKNPKVMPETLIIRGNRDRVIPGYLTANLIQRLPMARVRTLDAGHLIPITNQEQLVKILEVYLSNTK
jgi:pimeloyl-ACP methyl ester carboxylesterase